MALTPKREKFVQGLAAGLSQRKAYQQAYNTERMKDATIDNNAYKLMQKNDILTRYNELMNEHSEKALWTREQSVNTLKWLLNQSIESVKSEKFDKGYVRQGTANAIVSAIKELNELELLYPIQQAQLEKIRGDKSDADERIVFVEPDELMKDYMEGNSHEYENMDK